jgi:hypothetical protein
MAVSHNGTNGCWSDYTGRKIIMLRPSLLAMATVAMTAGIAHADTFAGNLAFADNGSSFNAVNFTLASNSPTTFSETIAGAGTAVNVSDFLTLNSTLNPLDPLGNTDTLDVTFSFTAPNTASGSQSGSGTENLSIGLLGFVDNGTITWGAPVTLNFADGAKLQVSLDNINLSEFADLNNAITYDVGATFTLETAATPAPVPEPASLALVGAGLLGFGWLRRRNAA